jgi:hypothetical protein
MGCGHMDALNTYFSYAGLGLLGGYIGVYTIALRFGYWDPFKSLNLYSLLAYDHPIIFFETLFIQILGGYLGGSFTRKRWIALLGGFVLTIILSTFILIPMWF